jgi:CMP-N,N'-diacetyllegionaminic acid synthase
VFNDTLVVITARGGSKGIPNKNIRLLGGKPLIHFSIEAARDFFSDENICVSTDSEEIKRVCEQTELKVPFLRPADLATDTAGTYEVLLDAVNFYKNVGKEFKKILLMQPTSPFRKVKHFKDIFNLYDAQTDMVVSVGESHHNPYFSLFEENKDGYLVKSKKASFERRQDCPSVFYYNGSMYLINNEILQQKPLAQFTRVRKYVMEEKYCLDIDTPLDWLICESLFEKGIYINEND